MTKVTVKATPGSHISDVYLELIKRLRLLDDNFFHLCMQDNKRAVELMLRIIIGDKSLKVIKLVVQLEMKNIAGHSLYLDVYAVNDQGAEINVEIQRDDAGAVAERAVCHSGTLDANSLKKGERDFRKKSETYTIFITERDVLGGDLPIYHIERKITELNNAPFGGKSHIIYVNCAYKRDDDSDLCKLIHDLGETDPDKMNFQELSERVRYFKQSSEGMGLCVRFGKKWKIKGLRRVSRRVSKKRLYPC